MKPDLTIFVKVDEKTRQKRITERGKSILDKVLDDSKKREEFNKKFDYYLGLEESPTIVFNNDSTNIQQSVKELFKTIKERG